MENKVYKRGVLEKVKELKRKIWRASEGRADKRNLVRNKRPDRKPGNEAGFETQGQLFHHRDGRLHKHSARELPAGSNTGTMGSEQSPRQAGQDLPGQAGQSPEAETLLHLQRLSLPCSAPRRPTHGHKSH